MASKKFEKGSEEWQFFQDYWNFRQKYYEADNDDSWWDEFIRESTDLEKKYRNSEISFYANKLIVAHIDDVDRRFRKAMNINELGK